MKRVISYPPVVILLDILFVFLFVLILSSSKENIQITIPKDKLFDEAKILLIQNNQYYEYNTNSKEITHTYFEFSDRFNKIIDCENQKECIEAKNKFGQDKKFVILLPKHIFENISKISMIAFSETSCQELHFDIKQDASFDKEELLKENKCLADISRFKENF